MGIPRNTLRPEVEAAVTAYEDALHAQKEAVLESRAAFVVKSEAETKVGNAYSEMMRAIRK